jgi:hypothetical protein
MRYNFTMYDFQPNKSLSGKAVKDCKDNCHDWFCKCQPIVNELFRAIPNNLPVIPNSFAAVSFRNPVASRVSFRTQREICVYYSQSFPHTSDPSFQFGMTRERSRDDIQKMT